MSGTAAILRALARTAHAAGIEARFDSEAAVPWASATFSGTCHRIACHARDGAARARWLQALPEADFAIAGHLVADLAVVDDGAERATIVALTLIEA